MSGDLPPPPGWQPPQAQQPSPWGAPPPGPPPTTQQPPWPGYAPPRPVAHKPGAIPLRPLVLSDVFDGAFRIIRYNPRATIGATVLVSAVAMVVPIVAALATGSTGGLRLDATDGSISDSQVESLLVALGGLLVGAQLQAVGLLFVTGMIAHVTSAAAVGRKLSMAQAWRATRGKRWRLLGMAFLLALAVIAVTAVAVVLVVVVAVGFKPPLGEVVLFGLVLALVLVAGYLWFWIRVRALAVPALMLEPVGVFGALRRAVHLSRRQFWRLLGLLLLVSLVVHVAASLLQLPFRIVGEVFLTASPDGGYGLMLYVVLFALGTVVSAAVVEPFTAAVSALLYVDQRIRKEGYDVELLHLAGILPG